MLQKNIERELRLFVDKWSHSVIEGSWLLLGQHLFLQEFLMNVLSLNHFLFKFIEAVVDTLRQQRSLSPPARAYPAATSYDQLFSGSILRLLLYSGGHILAVADAIQFIFFVYFIRFTRCLLLLLLIIVVRLQGLGEGVPAPPMRFIRLVVDVA